MAYTASYIYEMNDRLQKRKKRRLLLNVAAHFIGIICAEKWWGRNKSFIRGCIAPPMSGSYYRFEDMRTERRIKAIRSALMGLPL